MKLYTKIKSSSKYWGFSSSTAAVVMLVVNRLVDLNSDEAVIFTAFVGVCINIALVAYFHGKKGVQELIEDEAK